MLEYNHPERQESYNRFQIIVIFISICGEIQLA